MSSTLCVTHCMLTGMAGIQTLMASKSPVARFLQRYTRPKAPLLMGFRISKSSIVMLLMLLPLALIAGVAAPAIVIVNEGAAPQRDQRSGNQDEPQLVGPKQPQGLNGNQSLLSSRKQRGDGVSHCSSCLWQVWNMLLPWGADRRPCSANSLMLIQACSSQHDHGKGNKVAELLAWVCSRHGAL